MCHPGRHGVRHLLFTLRHCDLLELLTEPIIPRDADACTGESADRVTAVFERVRGKDALQRANARARGVGDKKRHVDRGAAWQIFLQVQWLILPWDGDGAQCSV